MIPVTCRKCGAVFITKNIAYVGYSKVYYTMTMINAGIAVMEDIV